MWHQIELALAADIRAGVLLPGTRLPNEETLAAAFGVHRHTARRALATLAEKGAVRIRRGLGTFVEPPILTYPISGQTRFTATLEQQNRSAGHELLDAFEKVADPHVAELLKISPGAILTVLRTLGLADGIPVSVGLTCFPNARFSGLADLYRELKSVTAVLKHFGFPDYRRAMTSITAVLPTAQEATQLRQSRREPVLAVESVDVDSDGLPLSFSQVRFAGQRVQLVVEDQL